jgi:putative protease
VETPIKAPLTLERVEEALKKSGESPFVITAILVDHFSEGFLPIRELNEMRRLLLEDLAEDQMKSAKRALPEQTDREPHPMKQEIRENLRLVSVSTKEQLTLALEMGVKDLAVYPFYRGARYINFRDVAKVLEEHKDIRLYVKVSNILRKELHAIVEKVKKLEDHGRLAGIITNNAGVIRLLGKDFYIIGDYKLNIMNSDALKFYGEDLAMSMVSEELNRQELKGLKNKERYITLVYGRQEMMHSEYCPVGATVGGMTREVPCNEACMKESYRLKDRMGEEFPVMTDIFCRSYIMNGKPKNLLDSTKDLEHIGIRSLRIDLTTESAEEAREVLHAFLHGEALELLSFNRGHYKRGVE